MSKFDLYGKCEERIGLGTPGSSSAQGRRRAFDSASRYSWFVIVARDRLRPAWRDLASSRRRREAPVGFVGVR